MVLVPLVRQHKAPAVRHIVEAALHVRHRAVDAVLLPDNVILQLALAVKALQGTRLRRFGHAVAVFIAREKAEENFLRGYLICVRAEGDVLQPPALERQHVRHGQVVARHARHEQRVLPARQRAGRRRLSSATEADRRSEDFACSAPSSQS